MATYTQSELLLDTFGGAIGATVAARPPDYGGPWTANGAIALPVLDGAGGCYHHTAGTPSGDQPCAVTPLAPGPDQLVQAVIHCLSNVPSGSTAGIALRWSDNSNSYSLQYTSGDTQIGLFLGGDTAITYYDLPGATALDPGAALAIMLTITGQTLQATIGGIRQDPIDDPTVTDAGHCGILSSSSDDDLTASTGLHVRQFLASAVPA